MTYLSAEQNSSILSWQAWIHKRCSVWIDSGISIKMFNLYPEEIKPMKPCSVFLMLLFIL